MLKSKEAFLKLFKINSRSKYYDPIFLSDTEFGFSVKRKYPKQISYRPPLKGSGEPDVVAVLWVVLDTKNASDEKILVTVRIAPVSLWTTKRLDLDERNLESPTKESIEASNKTRKPESLFYGEEFFYNIKTKILVDPKNKPISGVEILDKAFKEHCETAHRLKGAELRIKQSLRKTLDFVLTIFINTIKQILKKIFGCEITAEDTISEYYKGYQSIKTQQINPIEILGYKAAKSTIVIFSTLVVIFSVLAYLEIIKLNYLEYISDDNTLILAHVIFTLTAIEYLPRLIFILLNQLIKFRASITFIKINPFSYKKWLPIFIKIIVLAIAILLIEKYNNSIIGMISITRIENPT